jgi:PTH1 family peptidyl-tRNA hydrolase
MADSKTILIVGLGNPGSRYALTRHNIGFQVVDRIVEKYRLVAVKSPIQADITEGKIAGASVLAARPLAYMNRSGGPVRDLLQNRGIPRGDMVVIHDDIDLAYERLKIKEKGGDGGHNGLRSLMDALGTDQFARVRLGVGRPETDIGVVEYVLGDFDADQRARLNAFLSQAIAAVETILCEGAKEAMNRFNKKT